MIDVREQTDEDELIHENQERDVRESRLAKPDREKAPESGAADAQPVRKKLRDRSLSEVAERAKRAPSGR